MNKPKQELFESRSVVSEEWAAKSEKWAPHQSLREIFDNLSLVSDKWEPYFDVYETYFSKFRDKSPTVVEVGVQRGGSLEMWRKYFGTGATIIGVDRDPLVRSVPNAELIIGDQTDNALWDRIFDQYGEIDCFIDDGSHVNEHQIATFVKVWPNIRYGGVYICEDTHTSYWEGEWNGGYPKDDSFTSTMKALADAVNMEHIKNFTFPDSYVNLVKDIGFVGFYNSQVVITKTKTPFTRVFGGPKS